jgi:branched-chain amino acid aminotransferase
VTDSKTIVYFNGQFVPLEDAKVSVMNHTFLYGIAVFEGMRGYWNPEHQQMYIFKMREHYERMIDSMKIMRFPITHSIDEMCQLTIELLNRNQPKIDTYVRATIYDDVNAIGVSIGEKTQFNLFPVPLGDYYHGKGDGLKVCVSNWRRLNDNAIPNRAKIVGAYAGAAIAKTDALKAGFDECIVLSEDGNIAEGSAMNLFVVKKGRIATPMTTDRILEGVTRDTIMELFEKEFGLEVVARPVNRSELYTADELFLTGTAAQVTPILEVDKRTVGDGQPGELTKKMRERYISVCKGEKPAYQKWLTPVYPTSVAKPSETRVVTKT